MNNWILRYGMLSDAFEVTLNGKKVYSKLKTNKFPNCEAVSLLQSSQIIDINSKNHFKTHTIVSTFLFNFISGFM